jgi:hypothetical protein
LETPKEFLGGFVRCGKVARSVEIDVRITAARSLLAQSIERSTATNHQEPTHDCRSRRIEPRSLLPDLSIRIANDFFSVFAHSKDCECKREHLADGEIVQLAKRGLLARIYSCDERLEGLFAARVRA